MAEPLVNQNAPVLPGAPDKVPAPGAPQTPGAATAPATPQEELASSKLQLLVRREKQALARESAAKTIEARAQAREDALAAREAKLTEFETLKTTNPRKALELLGLSYSDLTQVELNDGEVTPEIIAKRAEAKVLQLQKEREDEKRQNAENSKKQAQEDELRVTQDFQREIDSFVGENAKTYELIQFEGQQKLVYDTINAHYERTMDPDTGVGKIMGIKEACELVEAWLDKKYDKALSLEKLKKKVAPPPPQKFGAKPQPNPTQPKTLTNSMSATPERPRSSVMTDEERIAKAIAYARGLRPTAG